MDAFGKEYHIWKLAESVNKALNVVNNRWCVQRKCLIEI